MKKVTVKHKSNGYQEVWLNNADGFDPLTPSLARAATRIAFGVAATVTVSDRETAYKVYKGTRCEKVCNSPFGTY